MQTVATTIQKPMASWRIKLTRLRHYIHLSSKQPNSAASSSSAQPSTTPLPPPVAVPPPPDDNDQQTLPTTSSGKDKQIPSVSQTSSTQASSTIKNKRKNNIPLPMRIKSLLKGQTGEGFTIYNILLLLIQIVGFAAVVISLDKTERTLNQASYQGLNDRQFAINSIFVDEQKSELYPYFNCEKTKAPCPTLAQSGPLYGRVRSLAFIKLDFYQEVLENRRYYDIENDELNRFLLDEERVQRWVRLEDNEAIKDVGNASTWLYTLRSAIQGSPAICEVMIEQGNDMLYETYYSDLVLAICAKEHGLIPTPTIQITPPITSPVPSMVLTSTKIPSSTITIIHPTSTITPLLTIQRDLTPSP